MNAFWNGFWRFAEVKPFEKNSEKVREVGTVALLKDGKILMGKRRDNNKWTTPGGHLEGDEDPRAGAAREVKEESGITVDPKKLIHLETKLVTKPDGTKLKVYGYKIEITGDVATSMQADPDLEVYRWHWVNLGNLPKDIRDNLHVPVKDNVTLKHLLPKESAAASFHRSLKKRLGQDKTAALFRYEDLVENAAEARKRQQLEKDAGIANTIRGMLPVRKGYTRVYHGTSRDRAGKIMKEGLKPNVGGGATPEGHPLEELNKDLVFATPDKNKAKLYARQQQTSREDMFDLAFRKAGFGTKMNRIKGGLKDLVADKGRVVKMDIPTSELSKRRVANPEVKMQVQQLEDLGDIMPSEVKEVAIKDIRNSFGTDAVLKGKVPASQMAGASSPLSPKATLGAGGLLATGATAKHQMGKQAAQEYNYVDNYQGFAERMGL